MKFNRKAALEISITAIVVMIIAIVVLTLVGGFIKSKFTQAQGIVGGQLTSIQNQLIDDMTKGGDLLTLYMQENKLAVGTPQDFVVGYHNTLKSVSDNDKICFILEVRCIKAFGENNHCTRQGGDDIAVGGKDSQNFNNPLQTSWFPRLNSKFDLKSYESKADPATIQIRDATPDTYSMEMNLYKDPGNADCNHAQWSGTPRDMLYASKSFTLTVTST